MGKLTSTVLRGGESREAQTLPDRGARRNSLPRLYLAIARRAAAKPIDRYILLVYYTTAHCYQFSILDEVGKVYNFDLVCYSATAAEQGGRTAIAYGAELRSADENLRFSRSEAADRTEFCAGDAL